MKVERICKQCNQAFLTESRYVKRGDGKFCSMACTRLASHRRIGKTCEQCGKPFITFASRIARARVCSVECRNLLLTTKVARTCLNCGASFSTSPSEIQRRNGGGKYCSRSCASEGMVKLTVNKPIKDKYGRSRRKADKTWSAAVRARDNSTCQRCGKVEKSIHTHHVAPRSRRPDLKYQVDNGICLCNSCHMYVHHHPIESTEQGFLSVATYELAQKEAR